MKIISRKEAKALGLKRYFTGAACLRGHCCERYVEGSTCVECKFSRQKMVVLQDPERYRNYVRKWRKENSERKKLTQRLYYLKTRDRNRQAKADRAKKYAVAFHVLKRQGIEL